MVCDCGGGTVDITSYTIEKLEPLPSFEEICVGIGMPCATRSDDAQRLTIVYSGAKCGATSIDRALHSLMKERFGSAWDRIEERRKGAGSNFMEQWERTKRQFGDPGDDRPNELQLNIRGDSEHDPRWYDEDEGAVILTRDDVRKLFDPTVQMIVSLLTDQKDAIEKQGKRLDVSLYKFSLYSIDTHGDIAPGSRGGFRRFRIPVLASQSMVRGEWGHQGILSAALVSRDLGQWRRPLISGFC